MTDIVKAETKTVNLNSKRGRQTALENKIEEINKRLEEITTGEYRQYKISESIQNPESIQNNINIFSIMDLNLVFRLLGYFKNILNVRNEYYKKNKMSISGSFTNINGREIKNIINDLELRASELIHRDEINKLRTIKDKLIPFMNEESRFVNALKEVDQLLKS